MTIVDVVVRRNKQFIRDLVDCVANKRSSSAEAETTGCTSNGKSREILAYYIYYALLTHDVYHPYLDYIANIIKYELMLDNTPETLEFTSFGECLFFSLHKQMKHIARFAIMNGFMDLIVDEIQTTYNMVKETKEYLEHYNMYDERFNILMEICCTA